MSWRRCVIGAVLAVVGGGCGDDVETSGGAGGGGAGGGGGGIPPACSVSNVTSSPGECHLEADCAAQIQQVDCTGDDTTGYACVCQVDAMEKATFMSPTCSTGMPSEAFVSRVNSGCGWSWTL